MVQTALDSMSRRILDSYSTEFRLGVVKKIIIEDRLGFSSVTHLLS